MSVRSTRSMHPEAAGDGIPDPHRPVVAGSDLGHLLALWFGPGRRATKDGEPVPQMFATWPSDRDRSFPGRGSATCTGLPCLTTALDDRVDELLEGGSRRMRGDEAELAEAALRVAAAPRSTGWSTTAHWRRSDRQARSSPAAGKGSSWPASS